MLLDNHIKTKKKTINTINLRSTFDCNTII